MADTERYGLDYHHPYFGWIPWEEGDREGTKAETEARVADERSRGATVRMRITYQPPFTLRG